MKQKEKITFLGAGAMGWAIAWIVATYQRGEVSIWDRNPRLIEDARRTGQNTKNSISQIVMPEGVHYHTDQEGLEKSIKGSDLVVLGVPSFAVRKVAKRISHLTPFLPPILMLSKGMEAETLLLPFQIVEELLGKKDILHITGAGYGKAVHEKIPITETLASRDTELLKKVQALLETDWLRIETSTDLLGVQLAGALKNVLVIGIGMAQGQNEDSQVKAGLISEGIREMTVLGKHMGAIEETFQGPAGRGDLEISANPSSRNYQLGQDLTAKGIQRVREELAESNVTVEGFRTAKAVHGLSTGLELPILEQVYQVIWEAKDPKLSVQALMRPIAA